MDKATNQSRWRLQFSLRAILALTVLVAVVLAWRASLKRAERQLVQQAYQLQYAVEELDRARDEIEDRDRVMPDKSRAFWQAVFDGSDLSGVTITCPGNAFQRASFQDCNLTNATLQGGAAAFQLARFDHASLADATLTGGASSFQGANFSDADLTGAVLSGIGAAFQKSSFENAKLIRARLVGSFQLVNISGVHFEGADLSAIDGQSLSSCYFKDAPTYDKHTRFPADFDPEAHQWQRVLDELQSP